MELKSHPTAPSPFAISRRQLLGMLPVLALPSSLYAAAPAQQSVVIGASGKKAPGLYLASWNSDTGELGPILLAGQMSGPSFLALSHHAGEQQVYAVNEASGADALIGAFSVQGGGTSLRSLNTVPSGGNGPTHLSVSPNGKLVAVANYGGGTISAFRISGDGSLGDRVAHFEFSGNGPKPEQKTPHPHSARFTADSNFLLVNDLGLDRISVYRVDAKTGDITPSEPAFWHATGGSGPRHIAFHPKGHWIYSVNELDATIDILQWDGKLGRLTARNRISTAPEGSAPGAVLPGEIQISPDGRYVYAGNRVGSDTIAVFSVQDSGAALKLEQLASNGGKNTRHFAIDPTGRWMLLSNIGSNEIVVLERDRSSGRLSAPLHRYPMDQPMCTAFL
jgi:6-phosphogluconolactonase